MSRPRPVSSARVKNSPLTHTPNTAHTYRWNDQRVTCRFSGGGAGASRSYTCRPSRSIPTGRKPRCRWISGASGCGSATRVRRQSSSGGAARLSIVGPRIPKIHPLHVLLTELAVVPDDDHARLLQLMERHDLRLSDVKRLRATLEAQPILQALPLVDATPVGAPVETAESLCALSEAVATEPLVVAPTDVLTTEFAA